MLELTGVSVLAQETSAHHGWDPRYGVWKPEVRKRDGRKVERGQLALPTMKRAAALEVKPCRLLWRGPGGLGDSLGNVSFETLLAMRQLGMQVHFEPLNPWSVPSELAHDERIADVVNMRLQAPTDVDVEIQIPGLTSAKIRPCLAYYFNEFGSTRDLPDADAFWVSSRFIQQRLREVVPEDRIVLAPHGVNTSLFQFNRRPHATQHDRPFRFLYVGTTNSRKGIDLLLQAWQRQRNHLPDAELVMKISPTSLGFIWKAIYEQGTRIRVFTMPMLPRELAAWIQTCDVVVAPSRAEAFGLTVLEAMACGLPAIIPFGSAMDEFCPDEACFHVSSEEVRITVAGSERELSFVEPDLDSLCECMMRAHAERDRLPQMGAIAREAAQLFSWSNVTRVLLSQVQARYGSRMVIERSQ